MKKKILLIVSIVASLLLFVFIGTSCTKDTTEPETETTSDAGALYVTSTNITSSYSSFNVILVDADLTAAPQVKIVSEADTTGFDITFTELGDGVYYAEMYATTGSSYPEYNGIGCNQSTTEGVPEDEITITYVDADPAATVTKTIPVNLVAY